MSCQHMCGAARRRTKGSGTCASRAPEASSSLADEVEALPISTPETRTQVAPFIATPITSSTCHANGMMSIDLDKKNGRANG